MPLSAPPPRVDAGLLVLRIGVGVLLLLHGVYKLRNGVDWIGGPLSAVGLPGFVAYGAYIAEVVAPILLIVGFWARAAALVIVFHFAMAVVLVLRDQLFAIKPQGGGWGVELEALFVVGALAIAFAGPGRFALMAGGGTRRGR